MPPVYNTACLPRTDPLYLHSCSPQQYLQSVSPPFHIEPVRTLHVTCQNTKTFKTHLHCIRPGTAHLYWSLAFWQNAISCLPHWTYSEARANLPTIQAHYCPADTKSGQNFDLQPSKSGSYTQVGLRRSTNKEMVWKGRQTCLRHFELLNFLFL